MAQVTRTTQGQTSLRAISGFRHTVPRDETTASDGSRCGSLRGCRLLERELRVSGGRRVPRRQPVVPAPTRNGVGVPRRQERSTVARRRPRARRHTCHRRCPLHRGQRRLFLRGRLGERTTDWYAQDESGTVRYYGEATAELSRAGRVTSKEGSWLAGVKGANAGIFMPAHPRVGQSFRQEYLHGHAEDHFQVIRLVARWMVTREWTPLEPGTLDHKLYARGTGLVSERTIRGGDERATLVSVRRS